MAKEFNPMEVDIDKLRDDLSKRYLNTIKKFTAIQLSSIIVANGLSKKSNGTLEAMSKKDLAEIIKNGDKEPQPAKSKIAPTPDTDLSTDILDIANSLKKSLHDKPLTNFTQEQGKKALDQITEKVNEIDESYVDKASWLSIGVGLLSIGVDVALGNENIKNKVKEYMTPQENKIQND